MQELPGHHVHADEFHLAPQIGGGLHGLDHEVTGRVLVGHDHQILRQAVAGGVHEHIGQLVDGAGAVGLLAADGVAQPGGKTAVDLGRRRGVHREMPVLPDEEAAGQLHGVLPGDAPGIHVRLEEGVQVLVYPGHGGACAPRLVVQAHIHQPCALQCLPVALRREFRHAAAVGGDLLQLLFAPWLLLQPGQPLRLVGIAVGKLDDSAQRDLHALEVLHLVEAVHIADGILLIVGDGFVDVPVQAGDALLHHHLEVRGNVSEILGVQAETTAADDGAVGKFQLIGDRSLPSIKQGLAVPVFAAVPDDRLVLLGDLCIIFLFSGVEAVHLLGVPGGVHLGGEGAAPLFAGGPSHNQLLIADAHGQVGQHVVQRHGSPVVDGSAFRAPEGLCGIFCFLYTDLRGHQHLISEKKQPLFGLVCQMLCHSDPPFLRGPVRMMPVHPDGAVCMVYRCATPSGGRAI